jgi:hypothetical protein
MHEGKYTIYCFDQSQKLRTLVPELFLFKLNVQKVQLQN